MPSISCCLFIGFTVLHNKEVLQYCATYYQWESGQEIPSVHHQFNLLSWKRSLQKMCALDHYSAWLCVNGNSYSMSGSNVAFAVFRCRIMMHLPSLSAYLRALLLLRPAQMCTLMGCLALGFHFGLQKECCNWLDQMHPLWTNFAATFLMRLVHNF